MEVFHLWPCVHAWTVSFVDTDKCLVYRQLDTVFHAIAECRHHQLISDRNSGSFAPVPYKGSRCSIFEIPLVRGLYYSSGICYWISVPIGKYVKMSFKVPTTDPSLHYWSQSLIMHAQNGPLRSYSHAFTVFDRSLKYCQRVGAPQPVHLGSLVPLPPPSKAERRAQRKNAVVSVVMPRRSGDKAKGFHVVYSHGLSKKRVLRLH